MNEQFNVSNIAPTTSQSSNINAMIQSYSSIQTTHSDTTATNASMHEKSSIKNLQHTVGPFSSSLNVYRKRVTHRRNTSGHGVPTRDHKTAHTEQQPRLTSTEQDLEPKAPLTRHIEDILNEHLIMINDFISSYSFNTSIQYSTMNPSIRDFLYTRLNELSVRNPMNQRCSRVETKAFIDLITNFNMNRAHHYQLLTDSVKDLIHLNHDTVYVPNRYIESEDDTTKGIA